MRQLPEVGAQCGSSARWDLCGGCRATGIPTATTFTQAPQKACPADCRSLSRAARKVAGSRFPQAAAETFSPSVGSFRALPAVAVVAYVRRGPSIGKVPASMHSAEVRTTRVPPPGPGWRPFRPDPRRRLPVPLRHPARPHNRRTRCLCRS